MTDRDAKNIMVVGGGPHFRRIYRRYLSDLQGSHNVHLKVVVDLTDQYDRVKQSLLEAGMEAVDVLCTDPFDPDHLPAGLERRLDAAVRKHNIRAVIIATEPSVHKPYALWSLSRNLHILMDKPITTRRNAVSKLAQARQIRQDYDDLLAAYYRAQQRVETFFCINVQRRFHPGFREALELVREVREATNCPVTSVLSMHCDGQFRLPQEIVDLSYHGYNGGYGKISHSGYHHLDIAYQFLHAGYVSGKWPDTAQVYSSFLLPEGFLSQLNRRDYVRYFGDCAASRFSDIRLRRIFKDYGEIDAHADIGLFRAGTHIGHVAVHLLHNSFSCRSWANPNLEDLYKGNGRVKAEFHSIQQGPFQNIQIHSFQSQDEHDRPTDGDYAVGGRNHFDIYVFRNAGILGTDTTFTKNSINDLTGSRSSRLVIEEAKRSVLEEFLDAMDGRIPGQELCSSIEDHAIPVRLMSAIYESHIMRTRGQDPVAVCSLSDASNRSVEPCDQRVSSGRDRQAEVGEPRGHPCAMRV